MPPTPSAESSANMFQALAAYAPAAIEAISKTAPGTAQQTLAAQQATAPGYAQLQNDITQQYGIPAANIGNEINRITQLGSANTEAELARGPGNQLVDLALQEQQKLDPQFYQNRQLVSDSLNKYLTSYDPNRLTGSELEQINRGLSARQGPATPSQLQTIQNAQTFGNAATNRWQNFGNAVMQASSALPGLKSGLTGFEIATRRPLVSNTGEARLTSPQAISAQNAAQNNFGFATSALGDIANVQAAQIGKYKPFDQRVNEGINALGSLVSI